MQFNYVIVMLITTLIVSGIISSAVDNIEETHRTSEAQDAVDSIDRAFADSKKLDKIREVLEVWQMAGHSEFDTKVLKKIFDIVYGIEE